MLDPSTFSVAITTAPRLANYLGALLSQVLAGREKLSSRCHMRLCVSGPSEHVDALLPLYPAAVALGVQFEAADPPTWRLVETSSVHRRGAANTWQALAQAPDLDLLFLQDDVELTEDWTAHLASRVAFCREAKQDWFVLALYSTHPFDSPNTVVPYPHGYFFGNQALYFGARARREYAAFLRQHSVDRPRWPDDIALKAFAETTNVPLFCCLPNLAQHIGKVTTGQGEFHSSPTYRASI